MKNKYFENWKIHFLLTAFIGSCHPTFKRFCECWLKVLFDISKHCELAKFCAHILICYELTFYVRQNDTYSENSFLSTRESSVSAHFKHFFSVFELFCIFVNCWNFKRKYKNLFCNQKMTEKCNNFCPLIYQFNSRCAFNETISFITELNIKECSWMNFI